MELIKFIFSDFWIWLGFTIIFTTIINFIYKVYSRTLKHRSIMKNGYPPEYYEEEEDMNQNK